MNNKNLQKRRDICFLNKKNLNEINNNEDTYINYFYTFITVTGVLLLFLYIIKNILYLLWNNIFYKMFIYK